MKHKGFKKLIVSAVSCVAVNAMAQTEDKTLFLISNTHLDTQWNWEVTTTINEYLKNTLNQNMALMDKYPLFRLNYEGGIKYMWMKEYYPSEFEKMKKYISSGQWHVSGMSLDATDVIMSSPESILHSMLYANKFYMKEFGVRGGYDIMLPDCFGFPYTLPTLARHAGIKGFHTNKLSWGCAVYDKLPPFGIWQGIDGSQIYAIFKGGAYDAHEEFNKDLTEDDSWLKKTEENYDKYGVPIAVKYVGPRSDRGGGLKDDSSSDGENTPYWLNYSAGKSDGKIKVKLASPDEIFDYLDEHRNSKYQTWNDELPMRSHGVGAYTSWGLLKKWNRQNELLADAAEKASSLAYWLGVADYPSSQLRDAWVRTIWQQHHDGITGTSTLKANDFSTNEYYIANRSFARTLTSAVSASSQLLDTQTEGTPIVVYNPLSHDRTDIVEGSLPTESKPQCIKVTGPDGKETLAQITGYDQQKGCLNFIFAATVPSLGMAVYDVVLGESPSATSSLSVDESARTISNGRYTVTIGSTGDVSKIYDEQNKRTLIGSAVRQQLIYDHEDTWPAWEISYTDVCRTPSSVVGSDAEITLVEDGSLRKSFRVKREKENSTFIQYIRMNALSPRVDCVNEVDWQTTERMLKVNFPFMFSNQNDTYDLSLGTIKRGVRTADKYEVSGNQWADHSATTGKYGVSILTDCKYGWDKPNAASLRLTLLHTPSCSDYKHQANMDLGPNSFTYSIFPHDGDWSESTQMEAGHLNQPLVGFVANRHGGVMGRQMSFVAPNTGKVAIKALKKAEDTDELIVRLYEWVGEDQKDVVLSFPSDVVSAREVNALEEEVGGVTVEGNSIKFDIGHYSPKTFAVKLAAPDLAQDTGKPIWSAAVFTPNVDVMSYDSSRGNAVAQYTYAYPAELIPDTMKVHGVPFVMGNRSNGKPNALRIYNSKLSLDRKDGENRLFLLMASTAEEGSRIKVGIGDSIAEIDVPYFSGKIGEPLTCTNLEESYRMEDVAFASSHAHEVSSKSNKTMTMMYMYKYSLPLPEGISEVTLKSSTNKCLLFAATTSNAKTDDLAEFSHLTTEIDYKELEGNSTDNRLVPKSVAASHQNGASEAGTLANDMNTTTKWCVTASQSKTPYLVYTFSAPVRIEKWMVMGAARENGNYVPRAFSLQYLQEDGSWVDADCVKENQQNKVMRTITPITATKVRLQMEQGEQDGYTTRIYEFAVFGKTAEEYETDIMTPEETVSVQGDTAYDLMGRKATRTSKGVYIKNGKKYLE